MECRSDLYFLSEQYIACSKNHNNPRGAMNISTPQISFSFIVLSYVWPIHNVSPSPLDTPINTSSVSGLTTVQAENALKI
jgi:hypothetical protein